MPPFAGPHRNTIREEDLMRPRTSSFGDFLFKYSAVGHIEMGGFKLCGAMAPDSCWARRLWLP